MLVGWLRLARTLTMKNHTCILTTFAFFCSIASASGVTAETTTAPHDTPLSRGKDWLINFDNHPTGAYTREQLSADWNTPKWAMGRNLVSVVGGDQAYPGTGNTAHGKSLKLHYPKGKSSCKHPLECILWLVDLGVKTDSLYYGWRFKLSHNFDYVKGGKLPGVSGGRGNTGGKVPNGTDGWSVRMMWNDQGRPVQYVYHPEQPEKWGDALFWDYPGAIKRGVWHTVQTYVKLNTPGKHDGIIKTWLNGKQVLEKTGMRFRDNNSLQIDRFQFVSFFGGHGPQWAPKTDQTAWIDDVRFSLDKPVFRASPDKS